MNSLEELIERLCPRGVKYAPIKQLYTRLRGTPITAEKMREIKSTDGEIRIFAGGKTLVDAHEADIPSANIIRVPAVLVQSRGIVDVIYYDKLFTFKNEMWAYTADNATSVKFLYHVLKNDIQKFRQAASKAGSMPQISLAVTDDFLVPAPPLKIQQEIVRILDKFTELLALLEQERIMREKQLAYYRNKLLSLKPYQ